jgi:hypothetical protein
VRKKEVRKDHHFRFPDFLVVERHSLQNQKTEIKARPWERGGTWYGIKIVLL